jgi:hypothetical protein
MSATRNPYYQLPGGADLPGDVRVSDTADASKTAADGWAASPAAVAETQTHHKLKNLSLLAMLVLTLIRFILPGKMWMFILG